MLKLIILLAALLGTFQDSAIEQETAVIEAQLEWMKPCLGTSVIKFDEGGRVALESDLLAIFDTVRDDVKTPPKVDFPKSGGVVVISVLPNSPAAFGGIESLDVVYEVNGMKVTPETDWGALCEGLEFRKPARVKIHRPYISSKSIQWKTKQLNIKPLARKDVFLSAYEQKRDEFKKVTFYKPPKTVGTRLSWYVAHPDGEPPLIVLRAVYVGDDVLGLESLKLKADGHEYTIERSLDEKLNAYEVDGGIVAEWLQASIDDLAMLQDLETAKQVLARLNGSRSNVDVTSLGRGELSAALELREFLAIQK